MPRYYFHVWSGGRLSPDETGCALPCLDEARRKAHALRSHIVGQSADELEDWAAWDIEVTDDAGRTVLLLPIGGERRAIQRRAA